MKNAAETYGLAVGVLGLMIDGSGESRASMAKMVFPFNATKTINGNAISSTIAQGDGWREVLQGVRPDGISIQAARHQPEEAARPLK